MMTEAELWSDWRDAGSVPARDALFAMHRDFADDIAARMSKRLPKSVSLDDLRSEGHIGLLDAMGRFDPAVGVKFKTFAERRVYGAINDYLREQDWVPRLVRRRGEDAVKMINLSQLSRGNNTGAGKTNHTTSGKVWTESDGNISAVSHRPGPAEASAADDSWHRLLRHLPSRGHRMIVDLCFRSGMNQREAGESVGISEARSSQMLGESLRILKAQVAA